MRLWSALAIVAVVTACGPIAQKPPPPAVIEVNFLAPDQCWDFATSTQSQEGACGDLHVCYPPNLIVDVLSDGDSVTLSARKVRSSELISSGRRRFERVTVASAEARVSTRDQVVAVVPEMLASLGIAATDAHDVCAYIDASHSLGFGVVYDLHNALVAYGMKYPQLMIKSADVD